MQEIWFDADFWSDLCTAEPPCVPAPKYEWRVHIVAHEWGHNMSLADHTGNDCADSEFSLMGNYTPPVSEVPDVPCTAGPSAADLATVRCTIYVLCADSDGDGYNNGDERYLSTDPFDRCDVGSQSFPSSAWPPDLEAGSFSIDRVNFPDLSSFTSPVRRFGKSPGDPGYSGRWDLVPGSLAGPYVNVADVGALVVGLPAFPPMFGGTTRAFNGPPCTD
jgi:hypothetical protein